MNLFARTCTHYDQKVPTRMPRLQLSGVKRLATRQFGQEGTTQNPKGHLGRQFQLMFRRRGLNPLL